MKFFFTLLAAILLTTSVFLPRQAGAQSPEKLSYQAVIRDDAGNLVTGQAIGMQISILNGPLPGTAVYVETQTESTNANGLVSLEIGAGAIVSGDFATIDWAAGPYFIKTETDPTGGTTYTITGTNQLLSVPYALHAKTAESITGNGNNTMQLSIGDNYQGGIIFWLDATGQHGLIAAPADQSTGIQWSNGTFPVTNAVRNGIGAGKFNTERIIAKQGPGSYAAQICANYQGGNYGDWYLPSKYELHLLYLQRSVVGGFANGYYWSSSEPDNSNAVHQNFIYDNQGYHSKNSTIHVRAIRAF